MGMVTMYTIGVVVRRYNYRYPHNNYYFFLLHLYYLFLGSCIPTSLFILKNVFFRSLRIRIGSRNDDFFYFARRAPNLRYYGDFIYIYTHSIGNQPLNTMVYSI